MWSIDSLRYVIKCFMTFCQSTYILWFEIIVPTELYYLMLFQKNKNRYLCVYCNDQVTMKVTSLLRGAIIKKEWEHWSVVSSRHVNVW